MPMMLFLTGATSSIVKSEDVPQTDVSKSLGGYISSSQVPNNEINTLFDLISIRTLKDKLKETVAIALVNKLENTVGNITLKLISSPDNLCKFRVAAVMADENLCMEHINNRYAEPMNATFYDVCFYRASVDVEIKKPAISGESISLEPFDVIADVEESGMEGTWKAIEKAFSNSSDYTAKRLSGTKFRIESKSDDTLSEPLACSYLSTDDAELEFSGDFCNIRDDEVILAESLEPKAAIGIWLQRQIDDTKYKTDEDIIRDYDEHITNDTVESIDLLINYDIKEQEDTDDSTTDNPDTGDDTSTEEPTTGEDSGNSEETGNTTTEEGV